jgi:hypothetical protein
MSNDLEVLRNQLTEKDNTINNLKEKTKEFVAKLKEDYASEKASLEEQVKSQQVLRQKHKILRCLGRICYDAYPDIIVIPSLLRLQLLSLHLKPNL